jgi:hypothetical protein
MPERSTINAPREPIAPPELRPMHLYDAARIIRNYEGTYAYPKTLAEHLERMAREIEASESAQEQTP